MPEAFNLIYDTSRALLLAWTLWAIAHKLQPTRPRRILTVGVMAGYIACLILTYQMPYDFKRFWQVGTDLWAGVDYYSLNPTGERQLILNPPTILPLFQLWALFPLQDSAKLWTALNAVCVFGLVPLAYLALTRQGTGTQHQLSRPTLGLLATVIAASCATGMGLALGQVSMLAVASILLALWAQGANRPWLAGLGLAVATIKINTVVPFLTLFLRRKDVPTWISLSVSSLGLCLLCGPLAQLPHRCQTTLQTIRGTFEPGRVNDYSDLGDSHASLIGIDQALYRLGLQDRRLISTLQVIVLTALLAALARRANRPDVPRANSCALAALVASLFFYHRVYDELILVLPMLLGAMRFAGATNLAEKRCWFAVFALSLLVPYVSPDGLRLIHAQTAAPGVLPAALRAIMLPLGVWLAAGALGIGWWASSTITARTSTHEPCGPALSARTTGASKLRAAKISPADLAR